MIRTPVNVLIGMSPLDGDVPATCVPFDGSAPAFGYMTKDHAELFGDANEMPWFAEWNGVCFDLIEPMSPDDVAAAQALAEEIPF